MPALSRQKRLEMVADGILREIDHIWRHSVLPTELVILGRLYSRQVFKLGVTVTDVVRALENEGKVKILRTPRGKGWVLGRLQWDSLAPVIKNTAVWRLDRLMSLRKRLEKEERLSIEQIHSIEAELVKMGRFD